MLAPIYPTLNFTNFHTESFKIGQKGVVITRENLINAGLLYGTGTSSHVAVKALKHSKDINTPLLKQFEELRSDPYFNLFSITDNELKNMVEYTKHGIYTLVCEHDVLRDDGIIFNNRARKLTKKPVVTKLVSGGVHGFFSICGYSAMPGSIMEKSFNKKALKNADEYVDSWCSEIKCILDLNSERTSLRIDSDN